ncbi:MAG TPA: HisA/HisF-related TIM barrel protein [Candidatus Limnocylindrales bacterium]|nr:HisA/HisF-related TIM barrel protein [Candidatus Limnocylindrales bacterium]
MLVVPSIDLERGRSRVVFWPGAASGVGAPTDRPDRIAERFVELGARLIHLVDFDGARAGTPVNLDAIGAIASRVAVPLQVAGGLDGPEQIRIAFAAGATRAVLGMAAADDPALVRECVAVAGDWLAVGLDPRPERFAAFPWRRHSIPTFEGVVTELVGLGVGRFVVSHGGAAPEVERLAALAAATGAEILVAGGVADVASIRRLRVAGLSGIILGEALLSGAVDFPTAQEAAA